MRRRKGERPISNSHLSVESTSAADFLKGYSEASDTQRSAMHSSELAHLKEKLQRDGMSDPDTQELMDELARTMEQSDRIDEATIIRAELLDFAKEHLGDRDPITLAHMENLAHDMYWLERVDSAIELFEQVVDVRRGDLGENDPLTLESMGFLSTALIGGGRLQEALVLDRRIVSQNQLQFGDEDERTVAAKEQMAVTVQWIAREEKSS